jgi:peroxiredoxin
MAPGPAQPLLKVGDVAPEIDGVDLDGQPMKLSDFRGKVVYVSFWADGWPNCKTMYAYQNHLINRMKGRDFVLLGVNSDNAPGQAEVAVKNSKLAWRSWYDGGPMQAGLIGQRYGVTNFPTAFVIDKNGVIRGAHNGVTAEVILDRGVDEMMAAGENRPPNAPPRWQPGSTAFSQLADEVAVGAYRVRPPRGYVPEKLPPEAGRETYRWKGPAQPGGTVPVFEVSLAPAPAEKKLEALLEKDVEAGAGPRRLGWSCSPAERGDVNELTFVRARWNTQEHPQKWTAAGVIYLGLDGDTLVRISSREAMPTFGGPLDAAALTFHKAAK